MAKLITDHDPFHVHKILGVLILIHLLYRLGLWISRGYIFCRASNEFCTENEIRFDVACNVLHGVLSWSSLLLPLPAKRNFNSPMIWKEFRWHSIIFASRSVIATVVSILGLWPAHWALNYAAKLGFIMATCYAADHATAKYGSTEHRTTNAMPYPDCCTPAIQRGIKLSYALAQFNATIFCVIESPDFSWGPLIAIQGAPLLMTLVRKGKVSALFYHRGYILQLTLPAFLLVIVSFIHWEQPLTHLNFQRACVGFVGGTIITANLRMKLRCSKWTTWVVGVATVNMALYWEPGQKALFWLNSSPLGLAMLITLYTDFAVRRIVINFLPIFTLQTCDFKMPEEYLKDVVGSVTKGEWDVKVAVGTKKVE